MPFENYITFPEKNSNLNRDSNGLIGDLQVQDPNPGSGSNVSLGI